MSQGTHATAAATVLKAAIKEEYNRVYNAGAAFGRAYTAAKPAEDVVDVMGRMVDLIAAVEAMHDIAEIAGRELRAKLAGVMDDIGVPEVATPERTADMERDSSYVTSDTPDVAPAEYMIKQPDKVDRKAIGAVLRKNGKVEGWHLVKPNTRHLVIRTKQEKAA